VIIIAAFNAQNITDANNLKPHAGAATFSQVSINMHLGRDI
jgi:hypothetical protein